ncbi:DUF885 domain-containing protein, partial [Escherichia coli]|uniref:DUF885 domain-containing protein n=1 Tax=Escherichia coli TaxID=562 RepID=UPI00136B6308
SWTLAATPLRAAEVHPGPTSSAAWVARSNQYAQILLDAQAPFSPEDMSFMGIPGYDRLITDLQPGFPARFRAASAKARDQLKAQRANEQDPNVRQDLDIMIRAADEAIASSQLNEQLSLPWRDAPQIMFNGLRTLLSDQA